MKIKSIIIILFLPMLILSCKKYKLSDDDLKWQPYKKGDLLIFQSNKGEIDTIQVTEIEIYNNPDDPLAIFPNIIQSLFVNGKKNILELQAGKNGSFIQFTLKLGDNNLKYPGVVKNIKEVFPKTSSENEFIIEAKEYYDNMKDVSFDLRYIYWSKDYGYLGLEFKDNYIWKLKSFIRNNKYLIKNQ